MGFQRADIYIDGRCVGTAYLSGKVVELINDGGTFETAPTHFPRIEGAMYTGEEVGKLTLIPNPSRPEQGKIF